MPKPVPRTEHVQVAATLRRLREAARVTRAEAARLLEHRLQRSAALTRTDRPPLRYRCVLGEPALRSGVGGPEVMRAQLAHLIEVNRTMENVVIQVLPLGSGAHSLLGMTVTWHH